MDKHIESESRFVLKQLLFILKLPILLILIIFRKKESTELFEPLLELWKFIFQPKVTVFLIILNVIVFIIEIFFMSPEMFDLLIMKPSDLFSFNFVPIISSWFLHGSIAHLLGNMLFLYIFGRIVELHFGSIKMFCIYFGSAIISDIVSSFAGQGGIGASGAIAGLISASILIDPFYLTYLIIGIPIPVSIIGLGAIFADITGILHPNPGDNIGHFAHLGGYIAISILLFLLSKEEKHKMKVGFFINMFFALIFIGFQYFYFP
jgi:membrane associated rhomboid family serine protease